MSTARKPLWTTQEVLDHLRICQRTLTARISETKRAGIRGPWVTIGTHRRWKPDDLYRWLEELEEWRTSGRGKAARSRGKSSGGRKQGNTGRAASAPGETRTTSRRKSKASPSGVTTGSLLSLVDRLQPSAKR